MSTKAEVEDQFEQLELLLEAGFDPELTREELVAKVKEARDPSKRNRRRKKKATPKMWTAPTRKTRTDRASGIEFHSKRPRHGWGRAHSPCRRTDRGISDVCRGNPAQTNRPPSLGGFPTNEGSTTHRTENKLARTGNTRCRSIPTRVPPAL